MRSVGVLPGGGTAGSSGCGPGGWPRLPSMAYLSLIGLGLAYFALLGLLGR